MKKFKLVIVESPTKAKTISSFLDDSYKVIASKGHILRLRKHWTGIIIKDNHIILNYDKDPKHKDIIKTIQDFASKASEIYIATDEDREGEAIGYHITTILDNSIDFYKRIVFHEVTKPAILHSIQHPRSIDMDMVYSQQARRAIDRLIGYGLSGLLCSKIRNHLSGGRVQSVSLKLVIEKELSRQAFKPVPYYHIQVSLYTSKKEELLCELTHFNSKKLTKLSVNTKEYNDTIVTSLQNTTYKVVDIVSKDTTSKPLPPLITSTLQQYASNLFGYSSDTTMKIAQSLYEGVSIGNSKTGLITYMRTDSLNSSQLAIDNVRSTILKSFGKSYLPDNPVIYTTKSKTAQQAHECIRPTHFDITPDIAVKYLDSRQHKLYTLIYARYLASQMTNAIYNTVIYLIETLNSNKLRVSGKTVTFKGYLAVYPDYMLKDDKILPTVTVNQSLQLNKVISTLKETEPPARYSEATLIKELETLGIGRPSTYATIIQVLLYRGYVIKENKSLVPTEIAFTTTDLLNQHFPNEMSYSYTANLETKLDEIAHQQHNWESVVLDYYLPFKTTLDKIKTELPDKQPITTGQQCPVCNSDLIHRYSKYGSFIGCSNYPTCKYIFKDKLPDITETCVKCGNPMKLVKFKSRTFLGCSNYPTCKYTKKYEKDTQNGK